MLCRGLRVCYTNCWQFAPQLCVRLNFSPFLFIANMTQTQKPVLVWPQQMSVLHPGHRCGAELCFSHVQWGLVQDCAPFLYCCACSGPFLLLCLFTGSAAGNSVNKTHFKPQIPSSINTLSRDNQAPCVKWVCSLKCCWNSRQSS